MATLALYNFTSSGEADMPNALIGGGENSFWVIADVSGNGYDFIEAWETRKRDPEPEEG